MFNANFEPLSVISQISVLVVAVAFIIFPQVNQITLMNTSHSINLCALTEIENQRTINFYFIEVMNFNKNKLNFEKSIPHPQVEVFVHLPSKRCWFLWEP